MKLLLTLLFMMVTMVFYSQEYISTVQTIHVFGNGVMTTENTYYFNVKGTFVQQTSKKKMRVINVFDLNTEITDDNVVSRMVFKDDEEVPYLEYITTDLTTHDTAKFIYFLKLVK